ncbi:NAD(P)-dependent dehydrogenase (short-subunit alcohol dehydrogenase family) [Lipingzhangella halophila]|uniref:NAD(P)-dependent dehydrogenase (Short-subunit alcohol dehydrogenase family) n=1 Tax=Lipingzhangella halophila TaxID=1783352 RepID=A0A7W7RD72_9ACTN|nr:SDR family NAD(P)-dependent oxidoreductase [Lipingzhangella halophila]MBB4929837.1 NAD(P)-dependent dehydrogenase (short-subunit alcohol dehydrogenase family) [Lipingzhangella halophila]
MVNRHSTNADADRTARTVVITGGSDGMGRALALERADRGDRVVAVGSSQAKGDLLIGDAAALGLDDRVEFVAADLSTVGSNQAVIEHVTARYGVIDALVLAANRQSPTRVETPDGIESTFALYYLSRYILSYGFMAALARSPTPVVVNVAGVGLTAGKIHWDDLQLRRRYRMVTAQLQAGRANDLLGVAVAEQHGAQVPYVLYHPGFTRSGGSALDQVNLLTRSLIKGLAAVAARPVERSIAPVHDFIDSPPAAPLTAVDRGRPVPLGLRTLNPGTAQHLTRATSQMLAADPTPDPREGDPR